MSEDPYIAKLRALKPRFKEMGLKRVRVFGSRVRGDARPDSDLDLLIDFYERPDLFELGGLYMDFKDMLECDVDIVMEDSIHPALRENILSEAQDV